MIIKQAKPDKILPNPVNMSVLRRKIIWFYKNNGRQFPWRKTRIPYRIMIAEFMLHRTRAEQVAPIYSEFIKKYPTIQSLADAKESSIKKVTKHLGLHWRSKHFIESATYIREYFSGKIPNDRDKILQIPGVGDYTAGAILTVCYKKKEYVVDSNIARLINRYYGLVFTGEIRRKERIIEFSRSIFKTKNPGKMLYAIIDFTAIVCKPLHPLCSSCDLRVKCKYGYKNVSKKDN